MKSPADMKRSETPVRWTDGLGGLKMQIAVVK